LKIESKQNTSAPASAAAAVTAANSYFNEHHSDETFLRLWGSVREKHESIQRQLAESEKKLNKQIETNKRQIKESEKHFLELMYDFVSKMKGKGKGK
jgi:chaperonin cofactor prefoldin